MEGEPRSEDDDSADGDRSNGDDETSNGTDFEGETDDDEAGDEGEADFDDETGDDSETDEADESTTHYEVVPRDVPSDSPLEHEIEVTRSDVESPDAPLSLELSVTNVSEEPVVYGERRAALGQYLYSGEFVLLPKSSDLYTFDAERELWVATDHILTTDDYQTDELEPGATHTSELALVLLVDADSSDAVPSELTFELFYAAEPADNGFPDETTFEWGFSLVETE